MAARMAAVTVNRGVSMKRNLRFEIEHVQLGRIEDGWKLLSSCHDICSIKSYLLVEWWGLPNGLNVIKTWNFDALSFTLVCEITWERQAMGFSIAEEACRDVLYYVVVDATNCRSWGLLWPSRAWQEKMSDSKMQRQSSWCNRDRIHEPDCAKG